MEYLLATAQSLGSSARGGALNESGIATGGADRDVMTTRPPASPHSPPLAVDRWQHPALALPCQDGLEIWLLRNVSTAISSDRRLEAGNTGEAGARYRNDDGAAPPDVTP
jgi:hypothetical protein